VWTTGRLLTPAECTAWVARAEALSLERGDFIFKTGRSGFERMATGVRRYSHTRLVDDPAFAAIIEERLHAHGGVPSTLADGRAFRGVRSSFLVSKYEPGQFFAAHFDGCTVARDDVDRGAMHGCVGAFTCVLYLSDEFEGGATHYLPGQGSEVGTAVALRPALGCAAVHRTITVLHAGGELLGGTKYIMQFALMFDAPEANEAADELVKPLRWGA
jgi:hypothetical protein